MEKERPAKTFASADPFQVKQKIVVDVVITLVVEEYIVRGLQDIFSPKLVSRMKDDDVEDLASEPEGMKRERLHYQDQLDRLREGQKLLRSAMGGSTQ